MSRNGILFVPQTDFSDIETPALDKATRRYTQAIEHELKMAVADGADSVIISTERTDMAPHGHEEDAFTLGPSYVFKLYDGDDASPAELFERNDVDADPERFRHVRHDLDSTMYQQL